VHIDRQQLVCLRDQGFTAVQMARELKCSASVIYRRLATENLHMHSKFSQITDTELDQNIKELHEKHNNAGNEVNCHICADTVCVVSHKLKYAHFSSTSAGLNC